MRERSEFLQLKGSPRLVGRALCIDWRRSLDLSETRLGITASKRYGAAHERNRFKRLVREAFRLCRHELPPHLELNVVPRQLAKSATFEQIRSEMVALLGSV